MRLFIRVIGVAVVVGLFVTAPANAQQVVDEPTNLADVDNTAYGTTAGEFLLLGAGARGAALGGAYAALVNDIDALYWNPAGLALMDRGGVLVSTYKYVADTRYNWAGIAFPFGGGARAVGVHVGTFGFSNQPVYTVDAPDGDGTQYDVRSTYLGLTYSQNFSDRFSAGITGKLIVDALGETTASSYALDFGTSFHARIGERPISASFVIQNLGSSLKHDGTPLGVGVERDPPQGQQNIPQQPAEARLRTKDWALPIMFRFGVAFDFINNSASRLTVMGEFNQPNNSDPSAGGALEFALLDISQSGFGAMLRGGYQYQTDNNIDPTGAAGFESTASGQGLDGLSFGGGLMFDRGYGFGLSLDYAYRNLGLLNATHYWSATVHW
jgi:hypothetical protein